jgi:hypothetical protein
VGELIEARRRDVGLHTQEALAEKSKVSYNTIFLLERDAGVRVPDDVLRRLARALGLDGREDLLHHRHGVDHDRRELRGDRHHGEVAA